MRTGGSYDVIIMIARIGKQCLVWASLTFSYETFDIGRDSLWNLGGGRIGLWKEGGAKKRPLTPLRLSGSRVG